MTPENQFFALGNVEIDTKRHSVTRDGNVVSLTPTEWRLLERLASNVGRLTPNAELLTSVWGAGYANDVQYLRVWISRLRRKLEPTPGQPALIKTMQGVGYMLDARPAADH